MIGDRLGGARGNAGAGVGVCNTGAEPGLVVRFGAGGGGGVAWFMTGALEGGGRGERGGGGGGEGVAVLDNTGDVELRRPGNGGGSSVFVLRGMGGGAPDDDPRLGKGGAIADAVLGARLSVAGVLDPDPIDVPVRLGGGGRAASTFGLLFGLTLGGGGGGGAPLYGSQFVFFMATLSKHYCYISAT